jgi:hypothetical protein
MVSPYFFILDADRQGRAQSECRNLPDHHRRSASGSQKGRDDHPQETEKEGTSVSQMSYFQNAFLLFLGLMRLLISSCE